MIVFFYIYSISILDSQVQTFTNSLLKDHYIISNLFNFLFLIETLNKTLVISIFR